MAPAAAGRVGAPRADDRRRRPRRLLLCARRHHRLLLFLPERPARWAICPRAASLTLTLTPTLTLALTLTLSLSLALSLALTLTLTLSLTLTLTLGGIDYVMLALVKNGISPYISLYLPMSPHISPYLSRPHQQGGGEAGQQRHQHVDAHALRGGRRVHPLPGGAIQEPRLR